MNPFGLYVHFPWCVKKCPYCDFNSHPLRGSLDEAGYLAALLDDASAALADVPARAVTSVFCGGGTPSLFSPAAFTRLLEFLGPWLTPDAEITMEANPGAVEHHDFRGYRVAGINRLSLGAQSFDAVKLGALGRIHDPDDTRTAFRAARAAGFDNINLDLMYGLPGQTAEEALADLRAAADLEPEHLSWYQLTIEPKTEFARRPPVLASESVLADMEEAGLHFIAGQGYHRYEVSAFARPGRVCRHNLTYWTFGDYAGIGAGAHGKRTRVDDTGVVIERIAKASQPRLYLADPAAGQHLPVAPEDRPFEFVMNALRLVEGVPEERFESATGLPLGVLEPLWSELAGQGLLRRDRLAATPLGYRHLDGVLQRFLR